MTRQTNARVAGSAFLLYIVVGISQMTAFGGSTAGADMGARLATMAEHATDVRLNAILGLFTCFMALTLAVTLWALTRDEDPDLAMLGLACRAGEGVLGAAATPFTFGLLAIATASGAEAVDPVAASAIGTLVLGARAWNPVTSAIFFAVGSTLFCWLMLRGRMIPAPLAWLGVIASLLLVVGLPLQIAGMLGAPLQQLMWVPMAAFEIPLALWLIVTGVKPPRTKALRVGEAAYAFTEA